MPSSMIEKKSKLVAKQTQLLRILFLCFSIEVFQLKSTIACRDYDDHRSDRAGGKSNSVLTQFIKHMNKATLSTVISYNYKMRR